MHDVLEGHGHHEAHDADPLTMRVSVTIAILAVLVAAVTLLGHRAHTEELLLQTQATDQWNYYQAKNARKLQREIGADSLSVFAVRDEKRAEALQEKYAKEVERYQSDKEGTSEKARELEKERDLTRHRADRFDGGEALLEIGLVICSITLLTRRRLFWVAGIIIGSAGVVFALSAFLLH